MNCDKCTNPERDYCECIQRQLKDYKHEKNERHCNAIETFLNNRSIEYEYSNIENIVETFHWGEKTLISLTTFKFKFAGNKKWKQYRYIYNDVDSVIKFGKYKNKTFGYVAQVDKQYICWLINNVTDVLYSPALINLIK